MVAFLILSDMCYLMCQDAEEMIDSNRMTVAHICFVSFTLLAKDVVGANKNNTLSW